ncbi:MAG: hypothetical protein KKG75_01790 [Nanoarchaeota archaeon]|nr:hypothetical protein [Nanoarchaeota archaeon]
MVSAVEAQEKNSLECKNYMGFIRAAQGYLNSIIPLITIPDLSQAISSLRRLKETVPIDYSGPCSRGDIEDLERTLERGDTAKSYDKSVLMRNALTSIEARVN